MANTGTYCIFYVGAPHGLNEQGEQISGHVTYEAAREERAKLQNQARYYGANTVIRRLIGSRWEPCDPQDYE